MPNEIKFIYCSEAVKEFNLEDVDCCISCHDEFNAGQAPHEQVELEDGRIVLCCCRVLEALRKHVGNK